MRASCRTLWRPISAWAAAAIALGGCGGSLSPPARVARFESADWGVGLKYPQGWTARPGVGAEATVVVLQAPGTGKTAGSGASLVAALTSAPLDAVAKAYMSELGPAELNRQVRDGRLSGRPAKVIEYDRRKGDAVSHTRVVITRAGDRAFFLTFSAYQRRWQTSLPLFRLIEDSVEIE